MGGKLVVSKIFRKTLVAVLLVFGVAANATALFSAWLLYHHLTEADIASVAAQVEAVLTGVIDTAAAG